MLEDPIKLLHTITCRPSQIYFHENLFFPNKDNKLHNYKKLTNDTLETLLNENIVGPRKQQMHNKRMHRTKTNTTDMTHIDSPGPIINLSLSKIGDFGQCQPSW